MATTQDFLIVDDSWNIIASGIENGYVSNEGDVQLIVREAPTVTPPTGNSGHRINVYKDSGFYYSLATGQSLFVKRSQSGSDSRALILKTVQV